MKNILENGPIIFIDEKSYQQIKKEMCKTDDFFTLKEWNVLKEKISM